MLSWNFAVSFNAALFDNSIVAVTDSIDDDNNGSGKKEEDKRKPARQFFNV